ncbi:MAG: hypothetical protein [Microvirus sp.]|nr:MAG: hypothetical protein [Microvirus sp.]
MKHPHPDEVRFEYPDPNPLELNIDDEPSPNTLDALMAQARHRQAMAAQLIPETFEEADDFDVEDDIPDYGTTRWEFEADAAGLSADELFVKLYGITRDQAQEKLQALIIDKQKADASLSASNPPQGDVPKAKP